LPQKSRGIQRTQALLLQGLRHRVYLVHHFNKRIARTGRAHAKGEIALAQRGQHVRKCPEREHDLLANCGSQSDPAENNKDRQRPLRSGREVTRPEKDQAEQ